MKPIAFRSWLPALLALTPVGVLAQATTPAITAPLEVDYGGESLNGKPRVFITAQQCDQMRSSQLRFRAAYTFQIPVLEGWIGKGSTDCSAASSRMRTSSAALSPACRRVFLVEESTTELSFALHPHELFWTSGASIPRAEDTGSASAGDSPGCDHVTNQIYTLYILALNQATDLSANLAAAVLPVASSVLKAAFTLYTKRPDAPTGLVGKDGEDRLTLTFETVPRAIPQTRYRAYFDWERAIASAARARCKPARARPKKARPSRVSMPKSASPTALRPSSRVSVPRESRSEIAWPHPSSRSTPPGVRAPWPSQFA